MDQHIRAVRVPDQVFAGAGIARQHDPPVLRFEVVSEGLVQRIVLHIERGDPDPVDLGGKALVDFMDHDIGQLPLGGADLHAHFQIRAVHFEKPVDHAPDPGGSIDMPGGVVAIDPPADDEMPEIYVVVGMQMRDEQMLDAVERNAGLDQAHHHARTAIDQESFGAGPHHVAGAAPLGIGERQPGAQQGDLHAPSPDPPTMEATVAPAEAGVTLRPPAGHGTGPKTGARSSPPVRARRRGAVPARAAPGPSAGGARSRGSGRPASSCI